MRTLVIFSLTLSLVIPVAAQPGQLAPIDWEVRSKLYTRKLFTLQHVFETAPSYVISHGLDAPEAWGQDATGFGQRVGSTYGQYVIRETIELGLFTFRKEDPRYVRLGNGSFGKRLGYVFKHTLYAHDRNGSDMLAVNNLVGMASSRAIAHAWLPDSERAAGRLTFNVGIQLLGKAGGNGFKEFWPDVRRWLF